MTDTYDDDLPPGRQLPRGVMMAPKCNTCPEITFETYDGLCSACFYRPKRVCRCGFGKEPGEANCILCKEGITLADLLKNMRERIYKLEIESRKKVL